MEDTNRLRLLLTAARCVLAAIRSCPADTGLPPQHRSILLHTVQSLQLLEGYLEFVDPAAAASTTVLGVAGAAQSLSPARLALPVGSGSGALRTPSAFAAAPPATKDCGVEPPTANFPPSPAPIAGGMALRPAAGPEPHHEPSVAAWISQESDRMASEDAGRLHFDGGSMSLHAEVVAALSDLAADSGILCGQGSPAAPDTPVAAVGAPTLTAQGSILWSSQDSPQPPSEPVCTPSPRTPDERQRSATRTRISKWDQTPTPSSVGGGRSYDAPGEALAVLLGDAVGDSGIVEVMDYGVSANETLDVDVDQADQSGDQEGPWGIEEADEDMPLCLVALSKKVSCVLRYGGKRGRHKKSMDAEGWMPREALFDALSRQSAVDMDEVLTDRRYETRCASGRTFHRAARRPRPDSQIAGKAPAWRSTASGSGTQWPVRGRHRSGPGQ